VVPSGVAFPAVTDPPSRTPPKTTFGKVVGGRLQLHTSPIRTETHLSAKVFWQPAQPDLGRSVPLTATAESRRSSRSAARKNGLDAAARISDSSGRYPHLVEDSLHTAKGARNVFDVDSYFSGFEAVAISMKEVLQRGAEVEALSERLDLTFYWRGQADARWGVHSALHRALAKKSGVALASIKERQIVAQERAIVDEARLWIRPSVGARLTTTDLLARLQHHGVPTRLLDFSTDWKVALFFAVREQEGVDGRLILSAARSEPDQTLLDSFDVPWASGNGARPSDWGRSLHALTDHQDFLRIVRQRGLFLLGGTPSTIPQRRTAHGAQLSAADVRTAMSAPLVLMKWSQASNAANGRATQGRVPSVASALTIRIPCGETCPPFGVKRV
jgi:FRG domain